MPILFRNLLGESLRFEYQAGGIAPLPHTHTTGWRTLPGLMLSQAYRGAERIFLENGKEALARTGELIVLPAGILHRVDVASPREVRMWVHVNYFVLDSLDLFSLFDVPVRFGRDVGMRIGASIGDWVARERGLDAASPLARAAAANEFGFGLLGLLAPSCRPKAEMEKRVAGMRRFWPVIEHMRRNFGAPLRRDALAQLAFLSPTQFHCAFKKAAGVSPIKFLENIRLRHAQRLLITTPGKVSSIARECGYEDQYVFSKFFKRACGLSPSDYRLTTADIRGVPADPAAGV
jgi:AraC-like DNA-binding protein